MSLPLRTVICRLMLLALGISASAEVQATWSIVAVDQLTQEVAIGSATCVTGIDLLALSPAVVVGRGGGAMQSQVDGNGARRLAVFNGLLAGQSSQQIIDQLAGFAGSDFHQNGVADAEGSSATFSGAATFAYSGGVSGSVGSLFYSIQGNILTGEPVVTMAEMALRNTAGDLPAKLMAAMEAARAMGGDGRCSCPASITGCGSPPASLTKSADVGYMILARLGDGDTPNCASGGCANGDYFMRFNVANQSSADEDPVLQLRTLFDAWRSSLIGRPDAVASTVSFASSRGGAQVMTVRFADWTGASIGSGGDTVTVVHAAESAGSTEIGSVTDLGNGNYSVELTPNGGTGPDLYHITIDDGVRAVTIPPRTTAPNALAVFVDGFESGTVEAWS